MMKQYYLINATLEDEKEGFVQHGTFETENGVRKEDAENILRDLQITHKNKIKDFKFYIEGELIYEA